MVDRGQVRRARAGAWGAKTGTDGIGLMSDERKSGRVVPGAATGVSALAIVAAIGLAPTPALAACDDNTPTNVQTVTCDATTTPNPDTAGVSGFPSDNVTVNLLTGAGIQLTDGRAIYLRDDATVVLEDGSYIDVTRSSGSAHAIYLNGYRANVTIRGSVTTQGAGAKGVIVLDDAVVTLDGTGSIVTTGDEAIAIASPSSENGTVTIGADARVRTEGGGTFDAGAYGMDLGNEWTVNVHGTVETIGSYATAIRAADSAQITLHDGATVSTQANSARGIDVGYSGTVTVEDGASIVTGGDFADGIFAEDGSTVTVNGRVETSGDLAEAVFVGDDSIVDIGGTAEIVGDIFLGGGGELTVADDAQVEGTAQVSTGAQVDFGGDGELILISGAGADIHLAETGNLSGSSTGAAISAISTANTTIRIDGTVETPGTAGSIGVDGAVLSSGNAWITVGETGRVIVDSGAAIYLEERLAEVGASSVTVDGLVSAAGPGARGVVFQHSFASEDPAIIRTFDIGGTLEVNGSNSIGLEVRLPTVGPNRTPGEIDIDVTGTIAARGTNSVAIGVQSSRVLEEEAESHVAIDIADGGAVTAESGQAIFMLVNSSLPGPHGINTDITVNGTLSTGVPGGLAVDLRSGTDVFTVLPNANIIGGIDVGADDDSFVLAGGAGTSGAFDLDQSPLVNFEQFSKTGAGTWTLTGDPDFGAIPEFDVHEGVLAVNGDMTGTGFEVESGATLSGHGTIGYAHLSDNAIVAPGDAANSIGTLTIEGGNLILSENSILNFDLGAPNGADNDMIVLQGGTNNLELGGTLNLYDAPGFGNGEYTLIKYGSLQRNDGLSWGDRPTGYDYDLAVGDLGLPGEVTLIVSGGTGGGNQYWNGTAADNGGNGVWNGTTSNWTDLGGAATEAWNDEFAIFRGDAGTVTVEGTQAFTGMQFRTDGYRLEAGAGGLLQADAAGTTIRIDTDVTTTFDVAIDGGMLTKMDAGTLELESAGNARWTVEGGEVTVIGDVDLPKVANSAERDFFTVRNGATLRVANGGALLRGAGTGLASRIAIDGMANIIVEDGGLLEGTISSDLEGTTSGDSDGNRIMIAGTMSLNDTSERMIEVNGSDNVIEVAATGVIESFADRQYGIILQGGRDDMIIPGDGDRNIVTVEGRIETHGDGAAGIDVTGNDNSISVGAGGVVQTHGARDGGHFAVGIETGGDNNEIDIAGLVSTEADFETGIPVSAVHMGGNNNRLNISGTATTAGADTPTVVLSGGSSTMTLSGTVAAASATETAILFEHAVSGAGGNTLELQPGYAITGLVVGDSAGTINNFVLGGDTASDTFDVGAIDDTGQYRFFDTFAKDDDSTWTLTGTKNDGPTFWGAYGGTLIINAEMTGTGFANYNSAVTIGGNGTVGYLELMDNATFAPGDAATPIGTFDVAGNVSFADGSTYMVEIAAPDQADLLSATGTVTINGGEVVVSMLAPEASFEDGQAYRIVEADGGVVRNANFAYTNPFLFLSSSLDYGTNYVDIVLGAGGPGQDFTSVAQTYNQLQSATGLNDLEQSGDALAVYQELQFLTDADEARRAFDLSSGEIHASGQHVIDQTFALFNRTLRYQGVAGVGAGNVGAEVFTAPLGYGPAVTGSSAGIAAIGDATDYADARVRGAWAAPLGGFGQVDGDGNAARLDWWNAGLAGGYEGAIDVTSGNAVGGFGFGYIRSHGTVDDRLSTFDSDGFYIGAYGAWADGPWNVAGSLSYGANRVSTERNIAFLGRTAEADYWTHTIGLSGETSYAFDLADTTRIAPLFTLEAGWSGRGGFTETGAGALNLSSGSESWTRLDAGLGIALIHAILTENGRVTLEGRAAWEHAFADVVPSQALALAGSPTGFTVRGTDAGRDRLRLGAGLSWDVSDDMTLRVRYDGLFSSDQANHSASLGLNVRF